MLFSSLIFLSIFLPVVTGLYFMVKKELRNYVLLVASLIFYAWGEPRYLAIMLLVIIINYVFAILVENEKHKKIYLAMAVIGNLSFLVYFKYFNFIIENLNKVINSRISFIDVIMPIGISFYTFQALSYVIDVYRGEVKAQKSIYNVALYVTFFPQLIAGPIVKYHDIEKEIIKRTVNFQNIYLGLKRFSFGLGKKIIFANTFGAVVDQIFGTNLDVLDYKIMWLGAICYSLQLYFDFSGYSDMAIGLGQIFGFHFLENFNYPYISKSITEFWRRWHISLGSWFKEYLYIPLGGNRKGQKRTYVNLFIVFLATGIWHGASWTFVIWGLWHGIFIIIERYFSIEKYNKMYQKLLRYIYTVLVFIIGWVIFRADTLSNGIKYLRIMFGLKKNLITGYEIGYFLNMKVLILLVIGILASVSAFKFIFIERNTVKYKIAINVFSLIIIIISMILISSSTYNPFIYFRF